MVVRHALSNLWSSAIKRVVVTPAVHPPLYDLTGMRRVEIIKHSRMVVRHAFKLLGRPACVKQLGHPSCSEESHSYYRRSPATYRRSPATVWSSGMR
jgi:hypothetical protein